MRRQDTPWKPRPLVWPSTSTNFTPSNIFAVSTSPAFAASPASMRTSRSSFCAFTPAFLKCPCSGFDRRASFCSSNPSWTAS